MLVDDLKIQFQYFQVNRTLSKTSKILPNGDTNSVPRREQSITSILFVKHAVRVVLVMLEKNGRKNTLS